MLKVTDKRQNISGFWGDVNTTTNFCEPHYALSPYFAEFFNAWSSMVFVVVGLYALSKLSKDSFSKFASLWLIAIGIGSFLFHAAMRYYTQLADELPMVGFMLTVTLAKTTSTHHKGIMKVSTYIQVWMCFLAAALVITYAYFGLYEIFLNGFTFMVLNDLVVGHFLKTTGPNLELKAKTVHHALLFVVLGRIVWEAENVLCASHPYVWPMHTLWHFLSAASAYNSTIYAYLCRIDASVEIPELLGYGRYAGKKKEKKV